MTTETESPTPPPCFKHLEVQHRDGQPPWCNACGWRHAISAQPARQIQGVQQ